MKTTPDIQKSTQSSQDTHSTRVSNPTHDVIIAGAGPVGLFLACELALAKCSVLLLEKAENPHSPLKQRPFGIRGLSAPTIEALHRRGLLQELQLHKHFKNPHQHIKQGPQRQIGHFAGIPFTEDKVDTTRWTLRLPSSNENNIMTEMEEIESVLTRRAESLGVDIRRGIAIIDLHQTPEAVFIQAQSARETQSFQSKYLVGCDGARSITRKLAGFEFAGTEPEFTGYSTKVDILDPEKLKPGRILTEKGMYLQSQPGYFAIQDFDGGKFHDAKTPITLQHIQDTLRRISDTDVTLTALHMATTWTDRARQTTKYRIGRVLLAGDAAHIHAPLGGQGLNLGIGDAMNLGWKLAAIIHQKTPQSSGNGTLDTNLLDTYETERQPIGAQVLDWSRAQVSIMRPDPGARALNAILRDLINTKDAATYMAARVWGIFTHYDLGDTHPLLGYSMPNIEFENGSTIGDLMHDGKAILLDFGNNESLKTFASQYNNQLKYIAGTVKASISLSLTTTLNLGAALIRPDGYIAWAAPASNSISAEAAAAEITTGNNNAPELTELQNAVAQIIKRC